MVAEPLLDQLDDDEDDGDAGLRWVAQPKQNLMLVTFADTDDICYGGSAGGGKALCTSTPLPTPSGWTTMGEVVPGDTLFDERGQPCRVLEVSPIMHGHEVYAVRFDDGSVIYADAEHCWLTSTVQSRQVDRKRRNPGSQRQYAREQPHAARPGVITTREMAETVLVCGRTNHAIDVSAPLQLPVLDLPLDPYVLGVWLGDGASRNGQITCADPEIIAEVEGAGFQVRQYQKIQYGVYGLVTRLRALGVLENKHIPGVYLRASYEQRLALLQGLMDTDGTCLPSGSVEFYSCNRALAEQTLELILSLGLKAALRTGRAMLQGRDCGEKYRIKFTTVLPVFRLRRKLERQVRKERGTQRLRYVLAVEPVETRPVRCIAVDSPSHLFLVGRQCIPTHNSDALLVYQAMRRLKYPGSKGLIARLTFTDLARSGSIIDRFLELFGKRGRWDANAHKFHWPNGSITEFGYFASDADKVHYQGAQYDDISVDELTQWPETRFTYLTSRLRVRNRRLRRIGMKPQIRVTCNPGGIGHGWVKKRYVDAGHANLRTIVDKETGLSQSRVFISATVDDNQELLAADPTYKLRLSQLSNEAERRALLYGDWNIFEGQVFREWREDVHLVDTVKPPSHWRRYIGFDWGWASPWVAIWAAQDPDTRRLYVYRELSGTKMIDSAIMESILAASANESIFCMFADPSIWNTRADGFSTAEVFQSVEGASRIRLEPADNDRLNGLRRLHELLAFHEDEGKILVSPKLVFARHLTETKRTLPALIHDTIKVEDVHREAEDHWYDALRYLVMGVGDVALDAPLRTIVLYER